MYCPTNMSYIYIYIDMDTDIYCDVALPLSLWWITDLSGYDVYTCIYLWFYLLCVCIHLSLSIYIYIYIYVFLFLSLSIYIHIYIYICVRRRRPLDVSGCWPGGSHIREWKHAQKTSYVNRWRNKARVEQAVHPRFIRDALRGLSPN